MKKRNLIAYFLLFAGFAASLFLFNPESSSDIKKVQRIKKNPQYRTEISDKRAEYYFRMLRNPVTNSIPDNVRERELEYAQGMPNRERMLGKSAGTRSISWQEAGPYDVGGRTRAIGIDVANSNVIIAGGVSGGIWKSTDGGNSWVMKTSSTEALSVTSIAQDPRPGFTNIWYYTAGEYYGNSAADRGYKAFFYGGGFYKSTDNGETWTNMSPASATSWNSYFSYTSRVVVSPVNGYIYVASHAGYVMRSTNQGTSWTTQYKGGLNQHSYVDVAVNSNGVLMAYLSNARPSGYASDDPDNGVFISTNNGDSWTNVTPASMPATYHRGNIGMNNNVAYLMLTTRTTNPITSREDVYLYKFNLSTLASTNLTANLPYWGTARTDYIDTQGNYNVTVGVHPTNDNLVILGATSLFRSLDGFATKPTSQKLNWIGGYHPTEFFYPGLHPDIHTVVFDKNNPNKAIVGHDGGISIASDITTQTYATYFPWVSGNKGYNVTQFYTVSLKETANDTKIMGGTQDNGTPYFKAANSSFASTDLSSGDGSYCYMGTTKAYVSSQNGTLHRYSYAGDNMSYDGEITPDTSVAKGQMFINPYTVDPSDENYMYYLAGNKLMRNNNVQIPFPNVVKAAWSSVSLGLASDDIISCVSVSRSNPSNVVYMGVYNYYAQPRIFKLTNSKTSTAPVEITPAYTTTDVPASSYIHQIAVNPDNGNEILAVISNYGVRCLWYSNDAGGTWTDVSGNLRGGAVAPSIRSAVILQYNGGKAFAVGTSTGVYSTYALNGASTVWVQEAQSTIGNVVVEYLWPRRIDGTIAVGTHGRGAFTGKFDGQVAVENNSGLPKEYTLSQNYPNPFNPSTIIKYSIPAETRVTLKIYDQLGREVKTLVNTRQSAGSYEIQWRADDNAGRKVATGIYIYALQTNNALLTKKMVLLK